MFLSWHMTTRDIITKETCVLVSANSAPEAANLPSLVLIDLVEVKIFFYFITWHHVITLSKEHSTLEVFNLSHHCVKFDA